MQFLFAYMDETSARAITTWRYEEAYAVYNIGGDPDAIAELLDRRSPYYAVRNEEDELIGFFVFGTSALVWDNGGEPGIYVEDRTVSIGLGLRPDLTGQHLGPDFVNAGLTFAREQFAPDNFCLYVLSFNKRAIKAYEQVGFSQVRTFLQPGSAGEREFVEMTRRA